MFFVWKLNRPFLERVVVSVLLALGLCGMATVIARGVNAANAKPGDDPMIQMHLPLILCRLEDSVLIAASCAPFLKGPIERFLGRRFGVSQFSNLPRDLGSIQLATQDGHDIGSGSDHWDESWNKAYIQKHNGSRNSDRTVAP
jgi:hypothetical protein